MVSDDKNGPLVTSGPTQDHQAGHRAAGVKIRMRSLQRPEGDMTLIGRPGTALSGVV
jgi:hypothetical protein